MSNEAAIATRIEDPVLSRVEFAKTATFHPLGFEVTINSNSREILLSAAASFGKFSRRFPTPAVRISIGVTSDRSLDDRNKLPDPPVYRCRGHLLSIISGPDNFVVCDQRQGFAFGWVTAAVAENHQFFRYYFLDAAILSILTELYLAPIHGALVELNGNGVLLCGQSGAGKSTLAYACARAGWTYITDDACSLVRDRAGRFGIGNPYSVRFRKDAPSHFPELVARVPRVRANGKASIEINTSEFPGIRIAEACAINHVVFLNRAAVGPPGLKRFSRTGALDIFAQCLSTGDDNVRRAQLASYDRLLSADFLELRYRALTDAIGLLEDLALEGSNIAS